MDSETIVIEVGKDPMPENMFDGVVRTFKYPGGMEMTVGTPPRLDCFHESDEEFEARLEQEAQEYREAIEASPTLKALCERYKAEEWWS